MRKYCFLLIMGVSALLLIGCGILYGNEILDFLLDLFISRIGLTT